MRSHPVRTMVWTVGIAFASTTVAWGQYGSSPALHQPKASDSAIGGPVASSFGFPRPVVEQPSKWSLSGMWSAVRGAVTPSGPPKVAYNTVQEGDPTRLTTPIPEIQLNVHLQAARYAAARGQLDDASRHYQSVLSHAPTNVEAMVSMARIADMQGGFEAASPLYVAALNAHPQHAAVHNDYGISAARQRRNDVALAAFRTAVELDPAKTLYRNNYAKALIQAGKNQLALEQLVAAHPPAAAHYNFAYLLADNSAPAEQSLFHLRQALRIDPNLAAARTLFNEIALRQQRERGVARRGSAAEPARPPRPQTARLPAPNTPVRANVSDGAAGRPVFLPPVDP